MAEALASPRRSRVLLPGQPVGGNRYAVAKPLGLSRHWGRYLLRRRDDGSHWRLDVVEGSDETLSAALDRMAAWVHPGLVRVHEHFAEDDRHFVVTAGLEGHNLEAAMRWRSEPLDRDRLLDWGASLCRTLQFLHEGGLLASAVGLQATGVVVTPDERLVIRDLDFSALLGGGPQDGRVAAAMQSLADLLALMATPGELPPDLVWVVARCRSGDPERAYRSFRELGETLESLRRPDEAPQAAPLAESQAASNYRAPDLPQTPWGAAWEALRALPLARKALLVAALLACALAVAAWSMPTLPPRTGAAVYLTSGPSLYALDAGSGAILGYLGLDGRLGSAVASPDGRRLFVAEPEDAGLAVVDTLSGHVLGRVTLSPGPGEMRLDPSGRRLFVLHPVAARLVVVGLDAPGPAGAKVEGLLATAPDPQAFALLPADPERKLPARVAVAAADGSLTLFGLDPPTALASATPGELTSLVPSRDGKTLYGLSPGAVRFFDASGLAPRGRVESGGEEPLQAFLSRDGTELWVLHREGVLTVLNLEDRSLRSTLKLGGPARFAIPGPAEGPATLWVALVNGEVAVVEPARRSVKAALPVAPNMAGGAAVSAPHNAE